MVKATNMPDWFGQCRLIIDPADQAVGPSNWTPRPPASNLMACATEEAPPDDCSLQTQPPGHSVLAQGLDRQAHRPAQPAGHVAGLGHRAGGNPAPGVFLQGQC